VFVEVIHFKLLTFLPLKIQTHNCIIFKIQTDFLPRSVTRFFLWEFYSTRSGPDKVLPRYGTRIFEILELKSIFFPQKWDLEILARSRQFFFFDKIQSRKEVKVFLPRYKFYLFIYFGHDPDLDFFWFVACDPRNYPPIFSHLTGKICVNFFVS